MTPANQLYARFSWSEQNVERLRVLAAEGKSCAEIAKALSTSQCGPSRSAVLGKLHRLNVQVRNHATGSARRAAEASVKPARPKAEAARSRAKPADRWRPYIEGSGDPKPAGVLLAEQERERFATEVDITAPAGAKPIVELALSACRWPVGQRDGRHVFCGRRSGEPYAYCAEHAPPRSSGGPLAEMTSGTDDPFKRERRRA